LLPVFKLLAWTSVLLFLAFGLSLLKGLFDLVGPFVEDSLEIVDHLLVWLLGVLDVQSVLLVLWWVGIKGDVACK
jgi:hypothetical protein